MCRQWTSSGWLRRCLGAVQSDIFDDAGQTYAAEPDDHIILHKSVITHAIPVAESASAAKTGVTETDSLCASSSTSTHQEARQPLTTRNG